VTETSQTFLGIFRQVYNANIIAHPFSAQIRKRKYKSRYDIFDGHTGIKSTCSDKSLK